MYLTIFVLVSIWLPWLFHSCPPVLQSYVVFTTYTYIKNVSWLIILSPFISRIPDSSARAHIIATRIRASDHQCSKIGILKNLHKSGHVE